MTPRASSVGKHHQRFFEPYQSWVTAHMGWYAQHPWCPRESLEAKAGGFSMRGYQVGGRKLTLLVRKSAKSGAFRVPSKERPWCSPLKSHCK